MCRDEGGREEGKEKSVSVIDALAQRGKRTVVGKPVDREEDEYLTSLESTTNFVDPLIVPSHVRGTVFDGNLRRLRGIPEGFVLPCFGAESLALEAETDETKGLAENGTSRRSFDVSVPPEEEDNRAEEENAGGKEEGEPETDTLLGIDHRDLQGDKGKSVSRFAKIESSQLT